ncbi:MAG: GTP pyrophosphokinase family protein [Defluviitaleaceae bacterium]|nr:GTP pyrophosphokinase family protein [Defluviitaleaceae bacterium]MCL2239206.1 GTP pyrophosphokinase family protein [Defluviitaleaceae bacterium]MCL2240315.1 GTP pyrophosphokinase family protein [Defluviitaleaceae bacterium]
MSIYFSDEEFAKLKNMLCVYGWGLEMLLTKLNIIRRDLSLFQDKSPIEHIRTRIKTPDSIAKKLHNLNFDLTTDNARNKLFDVAGVRIITPFAKDIYFLAELLRTVPDMYILNEKDYVGNPKPSGYRSYHIIAEVPIFYSGKTENMPVEIQIRTEAMNFWATLEHKARYKYAEHIPDHLSDELVIISEKIDELDSRMYLIHEIISLINQDVHDCIAE